MGIIKRNSNGKWSVKGSEKYITYKRVIDLINEDLVILQQYDLQQAKYIYIGQCSESKIDDRHSKTLWDVKNKTKGNKNVHMYLETAITYQNIIKFFIDQKGMTQKEAENYLFRSEEFFYIYAEGLTKEESESKEQASYHSYLTESKFTNDLIVLSNRDSQLVEVEDSIKLKKSKKKEEFNEVEMKLIFKNNKVYIKFNDEEYEMNELKLTPIIKNNDIIEEKESKKAEKKPS